MNAWTSYANKDAQVPRSPSRICCIDEIRLVCLYVLSKKLNLFFYSQHNVYCEPFEAVQLISWHASRSLLYWLIFLVLLTLRKKKAREQNNKSRSFQGTNKNIVTQPYADSDMDHGSHSYLLFLSSLFVFYSLEEKGRKCFTYYHPTNEPQPFSFLSCTSHGADPFFLFLYKMTDRKKTTPLDVLQRKKRINVCAPMVRYSKLPFRELVRK